MGNFGSTVLANAIGLALMVVGWYISILNVGLARYTTNTLFTSWTMAGLAIIVLGAYVPRLWGKIIGWSSRNR